MNSENKTVKGRFAAPAGCSPMSLGISLSLAAVSSILAGAFPSDYGGIIFLVVATGLFGYVLTADFRPWYIIGGAAVSVLVAMACGVVFPLALVSLAYIPLAFVLSEAARQRKGLSGTVAAMTGVLVVMVVITVGLLYLTNGSELVEAVKANINGVFDKLEAYIRRINDAAGKDIYTENHIQAFKNAILLLSPSMLALLCMAASYGAAKVFRLATIVADSNEMFYGGVWPISASLMGSLVFAAAYLVSMFAFRSQTVYYSAVNVMYIMMPAQAIVGMRLLFGRGGFLRSGGMKGMKLLTIGLLVYFTLMSPIMIFELAAMFTVFYNIRVWLFMRRKNRENKDD